MQWLFSQMALSLLTLSLCEPQVFYFIRWVCFLLPPRVVVNIKLNVKYQCRHSVNGYMWPFTGEEAELETWKGELSCLLRLSTQKLCPGTLDSQVLDASICSLCHTMSCYF